LHLEWVSASEGVKFQSTIKEFTEKIREMGPSPLKEDQSEDPRGQGESHH
jgi:F420-non-reducing hydrogenase iron-sulfur subunit